ncbi:hypothetical protein ACLOJK_004146 [Asimina triloba]
MQFSRAICGTEDVLASMILITERKSDLAKLEAIDCGKPLDEAAWDMDDVAACFEYYADLAEALDNKQKAPLSLPLETFTGHVRKEPLGVVGLITPWYVVSLFPGLFKLNSFNKVMVKLDNAEF